MTRNQKNLNKGTFKNYIVDVKKQPEILVLEGDQDV